MGDRLVVGQRTLTPSTEVRILVPQPNESVSYKPERRWTNSPVYALPNR